MTLKINHLAVLVCIIFLHALGSVWYGPLFGERWMTMVGVSMETMQSNPPPATVWVLNFISIAASSYLLAWLLAKLNVTSGARGALIGFLCAFCFHHLFVMSGNMFARMPYGLAWIIGGYTLVGLAVCGFILGAWTKKIG